MHFRLPAFKVSDKAFVVIMKGHTEAILNVDQATAKAAGAKAPDAFYSLPSGRTIFQPTTFGNAKRKHWAL